MLLFFPTHLFFQYDLVLLANLVALTAEVVPLCLKLFVQPELVLIHLSFQLVLQGHKLLLVLAAHTLVASHLLSER